MQTINQIKKIQDITDPLVKQRYIKYFQLPTDLQQIMFSSETANKIQTISKKNNLSDNQTWWASHTTGMVVLGETKITDFVKTLKEKCELKEEEARQLARDINKSIFLPVQESLKTIHQIKEWPRSQEAKQEAKQEIKKEEPVKKSPDPYQEPQLNGNIVDLKGE